MRALLLLVLAITAVGCGADVQVVHGLDHRLEATERSLADAQRRATALAMENASLRQAQAALAAELAQVRRRLAALESAPRPPERVTLARPGPPARAEVQLIATRVWRRPGLPAGMTDALAARLAPIRECFRTQVLAADATVAGAFWVLYGQAGAAVVGPRIAGSAPGHPGMNACVLRALAPRQDAGRGWGGAWQPFAGERIAQLVAYGPTPAAVAAVKRPRFAWPWPERRPGPGGKGAVCAHGSRHAGGPDVLHPHPASPCAAGLRCCYPCGIAGCASVCMERCPVGLP